MITPNIDCVCYDETSITFLKWRKQIPNRKGGPRVEIGGDAGCLNDRYFYVWISGVFYPCHRIIWEIFYGEIPDDKEIDHKDHNKPNNEIWNLRLVTKKLNQQNRSKNKNNISGVTGVILQSKNGAGWIARWHDTMGKRKNKWFGIKKFGYDEAFRLACECRAAKIEEMNAQGAGYTEGHGK